ncbi:MAG: hypothetical protein MUF65_08145 [Rubritepida sp.]|nr:hypothetical protein [Rubritepida sp.]
MPRLRPVLLVVLALASGPVAAIEAPQEHPLWVAPIPDRSDVRREAIPTLLSLPHAWSVGDAAVVILASRTRPDPAPARLRAALLAEGAAVLELDPRRLGTAPDAGLGLVRGALRALRVTQGAGLLVVIGFDEAGHTALEVARDAPSDGAAAGAALGADGMAVVAGSSPAPEEGWPVRAPLLCAMLAALLDATARAAEAERTCRDALTPERRRRLAAG